MPLCTKVCEQMKGRSACWQTVCQSITLISMIKRIHLPLVHLSPCRCAKKKNQTSDNLIYLFRLVNRRKCLLKVQQSQDKSAGVGFRWSVRKPPPFPSKKRSSVQRLFLSYPSPPHILWSIYRGGRGAGPSTKAMPTLPKGF